jgi:DNA gyrase/topoisomerase IV subunit A
MDWDGIHKVMDCSDNDGIRIVIDFNPNLSKKDADTLAKELDKFFQNRVSYLVNITRRYVQKIGELPEPRATFDSVTIPTIVNEWMSWRIEIESARQKWRLEKYSLMIERQQLMDFAISKLDVIFKTIKTTKAGLDEALAKALKIGVDEAKLILALPLRQMSRMSHEEIKGKIKEYKTEIQSIKKYIKEPNRAILEGLPSLNIG